MTEKHEAYLYQVTFNAMHNMVVEDPRKMHAHTFRVGMYVTEKQDDHPVFLSNEKLLNGYFSRLQGIRLNELPMFKDVIPTLENMGDFFYQDLKPIFERNGMHLISLEIGDSPVSVYCVGERLLLGDVFNLTLPDEIEAYCDRVKHRYQTASSKTIGEL
ncbi:MAG: 6-carboxytetrahydropterin synthase [Lachnospiraceae bacterium]|nr:6-carboxytetrahydropterin synthase [Lachnospiraceae bacterium]